MKDDKQNDSSSDEDQEKQNDFLCQDKEKKQIKFTSQFKASPYLQQYIQKFIRGRKIQNFKEYWKNFIIYEIVRIKQLEQPLPLTLEMLAQSRNFRIIHYEVRLSLFSLKIKILNITKDDNFILRFERQINNGMFGTVYEIVERNKVSAIKELKINSDPISTIQSAVRQYAIMKLLAALQCGPALHKIFGYDLVISDKSIYFESQKCLSIEEYLSEIQNQSHFLKDFQKLQQSLLEMHSLNICHNDIKPCNILYSLTLRKLVFIDFGFSQVKSQPLGFMKEESAKGSFYYSCQDMKNLFVSLKQKAYIDTYYNDFYGITKSKQTILGMIENKKFRIDEYLNSYNSYEHQFVQIKQVSNNFQSVLQIQNQEQKKLYDTLFYTSNNLSCQESDCLPILLSYLFSECKIIEIESLISKNKGVKNLLQSKFSKYYWIFLELKVDLSVETTYKRLKSIILQNSELSYKTRNIIENILDPYFLKSLKGDLQTNEPYLNYMKQQHKNRQLFRKRFNVYSEMQGHLVRFDNFSRKSYYKFFYQIPKQLQFLCENTDNIPAKNNINPDEGPQNPDNTRSKCFVFQLSQLNDNDRQVILNHFMQLKEPKLSKMIEKIYSKLILSKSDHYALLTNIQVLKSFFKKAGVEINYQNLQDQHDSQQNYFRVCFNMLVEIILRSIKTYKIEKFVLVFLQKSFHQESKILQTLKNNLFKRYIENVLQQNKNQIKDIRTYKYQNLKIFQRLLVIFFKIEPLFSDINSYDYSKQSIDSLLQNLIYKMTFTLEIHPELTKKIKNNEICLILNILLEQLMILIYQMAINIFAKAHIQDDIERLSFYFQKIFNFESTFKKYSHHRHIAKKIMNSHSIFQYTKQICILVIFRSALPRSLYEQCQLLQKTQRFIFQIVSKQLQVQGEHVKIIKNNLFWQHFNQLKNQNDYDKTLQKIDEMFEAGQRIWHQEMIRIFRHVYQVANNNKKIKQMQNKITSNIFDSFGCVNTSSQNQMIKKFVIPIKQYQQNVTAQTLITSQKGKGQNGIKRSNQVSIILQEITYFLNLQKHEMSFNKKWYCIRQLIYRSIKTYPNQDINLHFYIQQYQQALQEYESFQQRKIQIYRNLPIKVSVYQFLNTKLRPKDKKSSFIDTNVTSQGQNQFWQEVYRGQILHQQSLLMFLLINSQKIIQDKHLILRVWSKFQIKIRSLFKGNQNSSLTFLEISAGIKQFIYSEKVLGNLVSQSDEDIIVSKGKFLEQISLFLGNCSIQNSQFIYKLKTSRFYLDSLLKIYAKEIKLESYSGQKARQNLIKLFDMLVENSQIYNIFIYQPIYDQYLSYMILFGVEEVKQAIYSRVNDKFMDDSQQFKSNFITTFLKEYTTSNKQLKDKDKDQQEDDSNKKVLILQKVLIQIGKFAQRYPCSNYSKVIIKISTQFCSHLMSVFIQQGSINYLDMQTRIKLTLQVILNQILLKLITQRQLNQLIITYLMGLNALVDQYIVLRNNKNIHINEQIDQPQVFENNNSKEKCLLKLFLKGLIKVSNRPIDKMQNMVRTYAIQLMNCILIKTTSQQQPKYFYHQMKYFRTYCNILNQGRLESKFKQPHRQPISSKLNQQSMINGLKAFQKTFKKSLFSGIVKKSSLIINKSNKFFLQKIKQKIIQRLAISV